VSPNLAARAPPCKRKIAIGASVLRQMPLTTVKLNGCTGITDLSPLADREELRIVTLPPNAKNFEFLRAFPKLERIGFK